LQDLGNLAHGQKGGKGDTKNDQNTGTKKEEIEEAERGYSICNEEISSLI